MTGRLEGSLIRGVAYDLNGVLIPLGYDGPHAMAQRAAFAAIAEQTGDQRYVQIPKATLLRVEQFGNETRSMLRGLLASVGVVHPNEDLNHPLIKQAAGTKDRYYAELARGGLPILPGAKESVEQAQAIFGRAAVALTSTSPRSEIDPFLQRHELSFDTIVAKDDILAVGGQLKPDPTAHLITADRLGIEPKYMAALEDSTGGAAAAHDAGYGLVVGIATYQRASALGEFADIVVHDYREFGRVLVEASRELL